MRCFHLFVSLLLVLGVSSPSIGEMPAFRVLTGDLVSPDTAQSYFQGRALPVLAPCETITAASATPCQYVPPIERAERIVDVARSLNLDAQADLADVYRAYDFVRNGFDTTPVFGVSKGAYATLLDGAGSPFDQSELLGEIVEEWGYPTRYVLSDVSFSASAAIGSDSHIGAFTEWMGPKTALNACQLLAGGGVPAEVNGVSNRSCSDFSDQDPLTSVTFMHVWIEVQVGGSWYAFDPSFKRYEWFIPAEWDATAEIEPGEALRNALPGNAVWRGSVGGHAIEYGNHDLPALAGFDPVALDALMDAEVAELDGLVRDPEFAGVGSEELLGGRRLIAEVSGTSVADRSGNSAPLYASGASRAVWNDGIPDVYRTQLTVMGSFFRDESNEPVRHVFHVRFDVADVAGRLLDVDPQISASSTFGEVGAFNLRLNGATIAQGGWLDTQMSIVAGNMWIDLTADHPYAAGGGLYMDETAENLVSPFARTVIVQSWGARGPGERTFVSDNVLGTGVGYTGRLDLGDAQDTRCFEGGLVPNLGAISQGGVVESGLMCNVFSEPPPGPGECFGADCEFTDGFWSTSQEYCLTVPFAITTSPGYFGGGGSGMQSCAVRDGDIFSPENQQLREYEAKGRLKALLASTFVWRLEQLQNRVAGFSSGRAIPHHALGVSTSTAEPGHDRSVSEDLIRLDVRPSVSYAQLHVGARTSEVFAGSMAAMGSGLERSVVQVMTAAPFVNSATSMIDWFTRSSSGDLGADIVFLRINASNWAQASDELIGYQERGYIGQYVVGGYEVIAPLSGRLGPGMRSLRTGLEWRDDPASDGSGLFVGPDIWRVRGSVYLAIQDTAAGQDRAFVALQPCRMRDQDFPCNALPHKGAGGVDFAGELESPETSQEALNRHYESWSAALDVDPRTGGLTITPAADIETGAGGFPYSLAFSRTYNSDAERTTGPFGTNGWSHNFDYGLSVTTDLDAALGDADPVAVLPLITTLSALDSINTHSNTAIASIRSVLAAHWWSESSYDNAAVIQRNASSNRFYAIPGHGYVAPRASLASLSMTGARGVTSVANAYSEFYHPINWSPFRTVSHRFDYSDIGFTFTSESGVTETYVWGEDPTRSITPLPPSGSENVQVHDANEPHFQITQAQFPTGVSLNFSYGVAGQLEAVTNSFGRSLNFTYDETDRAQLLAGSSGPDGDGFRWFGATDGGDMILTGVSDENGRRVTFDGPTFTDLGGHEYGYNPTMVSGPFDTPVDNAASSPYWFPDNSAFGEFLPRSRLGILQLPVLEGEGAPVDLLTIDYALHGSVTALTDAEGNRIEYGIAAGRRAYQTDAKGRESATYFDRQGRVVAELDRRGFMNRYRYDGAGRLIEEIRGQAGDALGVYEARTTYEYDGYNQLVRTIVHPRTNGSGVPYSDPPLVSETRYNHPDQPSWPTRRIDAEGHAVVTCYSSATNEPECQAPPSGVSMDANARGGLPQLILGAAGEVRWIEYDGFGRPATERVLVQE